MREKDRRYELIVYDGQDSYVRHYYDKLDIAQHSARKLLQYYREYDEQFRVELKDRRVGTYEQ